MLDFDEIEIVVGTKQGNMKGTKSRSKEIAIIGAAVKLPLADSIEAFWNHLVNGADCVRSLPKGRKKDLDAYLAFKGLAPEGISYCESAYLEAVDQFDYGYFKLSPKEASLIDPHQRLFLETAWEAVEDAGYGGPKLVGSKTGVYLGHSRLTSDYLNMVQDVEPESRLSLPKLKPH